jgi:two-component system, chemotaxis family, sensor kinase CheA
MSDEILQEFMMESRENLDTLDRELVALESDPRNTARLASIFRTVHTLKGTAGFFQFAKLEAVAHVGENLLSRLRDGVIVLDTVRTTALLAMVDAIRVLLDQIDAHEAEGEGEYGALIRALSLACQDETLPQAAAVLQGKADAFAMPAAADKGPEAQFWTTTGTTTGLGIVAAEAPVVLPVGAVAAAAAVAAATAMAAPSMTVGQQEPLGQHQEPAAAAPARAATESKDAKVEHHGEERAASVDPRIRVDVRLLDRLMNLVGELVLARNQLLQHASTSTEAQLASTCQRLNLITTELQEGVMKTRMQPIENVWNRFPRVVRDLSQLCGKQVKLEMEGGTTELDKTIIEAIGDPLTHLVRNSIDHGIELPSKRVEAGKSATGTLRLRAFHEGGRVNIEISDDGHGIDADRVKARALERGLITAERARSLAQHDVYSLLFLPGFSTAEKVTNISGRGVGLDVVKSNIERLGGSVDIDSQPGRGTSFRIRIPLTLAIIPALVIGARGERFAIPQVNLVELLRLDVEQIRTAIERIHGVPVYRLRGNLLALVDLGEVLELGSDPGPRDVNMIVLQADERQFGLLVDDIFDTEEIVVKPLGRELKGLNTYAGATIMGDGRVALILDVAGLAERAGVGSVERRLAIENANSRPPSAGEGQQLLLFRSGASARMAIPLESVARLEEFARTRIENVGGEDVVQYRGDILPLVYLSDVFGEPRGLGDTLQVLVHSSVDRLVGLVVESIEDVICQEITASRRGGRRGTLGTAVIQGRVIEVLDADAVCGLAGGI